MQSVLPVSFQAGNSCQRLPVLQVSATRTFKSGSAGFAAGVDSASVSSVSTAVSSMSVPSVPFDEGAIGEGSGTSLGLEAIGDVWVGCKNWLELSEDLV